jgi:hypothetical protein
MTAGRPLWRRGFDAAERIAGAPLEELVLTRSFNDLLVCAWRTRKAVHHVLERQTQTWFHFWNLPTRSDVSGLRRQVGLLTADLRELALKLDNDRSPEHAGGEVDVTGAAMSGASKSGRRES